MSGSSLIPIVVPIMAFVAMAFWLGLVFHADSHPRRAHKRRSAASAASCDDRARTRRLPEVSGTVRRRRTGSDETVPDAAVPDTGLPVLVAARTAAGAARSARAQARPSRWE